MNTAPIRATIRFTFALPDPDPVTQSDYFRAAREMVHWGDKRGLNFVSVDEHHATGFGWSPNPILEAGMILAGTEKVRAIAGAALAPLWNPVRLAEDIAVVDQMTQGRLITHFGLGYRPIEYAAMGKNFKRRGRLMDEFLDVLLKAWTGEPFEHNGELVAISPRPYTQPHPTVFVGGSVPATVDRAIKYRLPLNLPDYLPELRDDYVARAEATGFTPIVTMVPESRPGMVLLHEDPDKAWDTLGEHLMWEAINYGAWARGADVKSVMHVKEAMNIDDVKASGRYVVMSPDEAVAMLTADDSERMIAMHPLVGGMPLDEAWKSVHLLTDEVLPRVAAHRND
ncbi:MAG: LLM class flavin-dependent oxidoreductase [Propionibacterium sp.]|nr:LLM class flavin-dependent oxidoreductase [Propionibacterium sp.]